MIHLPYLFSHIFTFLLILERRNVVFLRLARSQSICSFHLFSSRADSREWSPFHGSSGNALVSARRNSLTFSEALVASSGVESVPNLISIVEPLGAVIEGKRKFQVFGILLGSITTRKYAGRIISNSDNCTVPLLWNTNRRSLRHLSASVTILL